MADSIKLSITTPEGGSFEKNVKYVNLPTSFGSLGILTGHASMLCDVAAGRVKFGFGEDEGGSVTVGGGVATVADDQVLLLVSKLTEDTAE